MQIKFLGTTENEDQIVEVPENVKRVEVTLPGAGIEKKVSPWPSVFTLCFMSLCFVVAVFFMTRG
jgi:hypothetical protein